MATNLRLKPELETALRTESDRTGRSQQELIRDALERYLGIAAAPSNSVEALFASGVLKPARAALRADGERLTLPDGMSSLDLLDRDERI